MTSRLIALTLLGVCLGYFVARILPAIFATWLAQIPEPMECDEAEALHTCGDCGAELQIVRPGKYQCPRCE